MAGLPPYARLRRATDFARLRHDAGRLSARYFTLRWKPSLTGESRLGMAVSRKVSKRAVARNRIKRVVRESFRMQRSELPPLDVLVIARTAAAGIDKPILRADLDGAWRRLQALKPAPVPGTITG